ncbi:MAG TPA: alpha-L-rhamnosidase N-terminal domain-containing protein, partial [Candidatus Binataceae bacterium]|nr:alpha-L-rhamnosidase N-terminal domain-containing protein [Candidatus Binataceae bacterium]
MHLRIDYRENPLGIDDTTPHFSWQSNSTERNWRQSAYEILVSSSPENLQSGNADVWNSGKQASSQSVDVAYSGPALESRKRYYWAVRVWDSNGQQSQSSEMAWWEMGLLQPSDWSAKWITRTDPDAAADRSGIRWIWTAKQNPLAAAPKSVFVFHTTVRLKEKPKDAALFVLARGDFSAEVNGHKVGGKHEWHDFDREDVTDALNAGENSVDVTVTVAEPNRFGPDAGSTTSKAALAGLLKIIEPNGSIIRVFTDSKWKSREPEQSTWNKAKVVGQLGDTKFGDVPPLPPPAALLRHNFEVSKTVAAARLYVTALGAYRV